MMLYIYLAIKPTLINAHFTQLYRKKQPNRRFFQTSPIQRRDIMHSLPRRKLVPWSWWNNLPIIPLMDKMMQFRPFPIKIKIPPGIPFLYFQTKNTWKDRLANITYSAWTWRAIPDQTTGLTPSNRPIPGNTSNKILPIARAPNRHVPAVNHIVIYSDCAIVEKYPVRLMNVPDSYLQ